MRRKHVNSPVLPSSSSSNPLREDHALIFHLCSPREYGPAKPGTLPPTASMKHVSMLDARGLFPLRNRSGQGCGWPARAARSQIAAHGCLLRAAADLFAGGPYAAPRPAKPWKKQSRTPPRPFDFLAKSCQGGPTHHSADDAMASTPAAFRGSRQHGPRPARKGASWRTSRASRQVHGATMKTVKSKVMGGPWRFRLPWPSPASVILKHLGVVLRA